MRTIETTAVVTPEHTLMAQVPMDVAPGSHRVVLVIEDTQPARKPVLPSWADWPAHDLGPGRKGSPRAASRSMATTAASHHVNPRSHTTRLTSGGTSGSR